MREIAEMPHGVLETIIMLRHYARAKQALEAAEARNDKEACNDPRFDLVNEIQFDIAKARLRERQR
jgi:hypothetical protein